MRSEAVRYLIVPGWQGSPNEHWQSHWQRMLPNCSRVEQADWMLPQRQSWVEQLTVAIEADPRPAILIAHSLGCITAAHWAQQAPAALLARVRGALLVAPADVERSNCPQPLQNFAPIALQPLPFVSQVVGSDNDSAASAARAIELARHWGSDVAILSGAGHINVKSGHQQWEQGFAYLYRLQTRIEAQQRLRA